MLNRIRLRKMISQELQTGGRFERVDFPVKGLSLIKAVQYRHPSFEKVAGLGCDEVVEKAFIKAFVEFYERVAFVTDGISAGMISSNGVGAYLSRGTAAKSALDEIYERDSFLAHWYLKKPMAQTVSPSEKLAAEARILDEHNIKVIFRQTTLTAHPTTVCLFVDKATAGFVVGLSYGRGQDRDLTKSFSEALLTNYFGDCGKTESELIREIELNGIRTLSSHRAHWKYLKTIPAWLLEKNAVRDDSLGGPIALATSPPRDAFRSKIGPIYVCGKEIEDALPLEAGLSKDRITKILHKRFARAIPNLTIPDLEPHPIP